MTIPPQHVNRSVYHFTHIDNLENLLKTGFLANNHAQFPRLDHKSIAATGIQKRRADMSVTCGPEGKVHDYVPLYFGSISPMLLGVINAKNVDQMDILYFEFPISLIHREDVVFTDASANTGAPPNFFSNPEDLNKLNWPAIDSMKWANISDEFRHQRMAELLVHRSLPLTSASRCIVWNEEIRNKVKQLIAETSAKFPIIEFENPNRRHWFLNFQAKQRTSLVTGPREIALNYTAACFEIDQERNKNAATAKFNKLKDLLRGLQQDFGCLPQTAELVGLKSENGIHKKTVDLHTLEVVSKLLTLDEFKNLGNRAKRLVEIAAYLHDIGKGPRSRWDANGGLQKVDPNHPVAAMPMMVTILTKHVGFITKSSAEILTKLVCYHDLIGDVIGKERDEKQIVDVASDKQELDMLFAIGRADATALVPHWWNQERATGIYQRCLANINSRDTTQDLP